MLSSEILGLNHKIPIDSSFDLLSKKSKNSPTSKIDENKVPIFFWLWGQMDQL